MQRPRNSEKDLREYERREDYGKPRKFKELFPVNQKSGAAVKTTVKKDTIPTKNSDVVCATPYQSSMRSYIEVLSLSAAC